MANFAGGGRENAAEAEIDAGKADGVGSITRGTPVNSPPVAGVPAKKIIVITGGTATKMLRTQDMPAFINWQG